MATKDYASQLKYTGAGYLDAKMQPVKTVSDLNSIAKSKRFIGLTVTVLDDGNGSPRDYWLRDNIELWELKKYPALIEVSGNDIEVKK